MSADKYPSIFSCQMEAMLDVYGKLQTAKIKLLPCVFSSLYSTVLFLYDLFKDKMKRIEKQR